MGNNYFQVGQPFFTGIDQIINYIDVYMAFGHGSAADLRQCLEETKKQGYILFNPKVCDCEDCNNG